MASIHELANELYKNAAMRLPAPAELVETQLNPNDYVWEIWQLDQWDEADSPIYGQMAVAISGELLLYEEYEYRALPRDEFFLGNDPVIHHFSCIFRKK